MKLVGISINNQGILIPFIISVVLVKNTSTRNIPTNCFDPIVNGNLENGLNEVRYVFHLHVANLVLCIVDILLLVFALVMICIGADAEPLKFKSIRDLDKFRILFFRHYKQLEKNEEKEEEDIAKKEQKDEQNIVKKEDNVNMEIELNTFKL